MSAHAISSSVTSNGAVGGEPAAIELAGVGVRYCLPRTGIRSIKEFALLSLRRQVVFDEFWALKQLDLSVRPGERLGVIGRNGAGKSTLMQVIARVVAPTAGVVEVHGRVAPLLQLGAGFDEELTGRENVYLNGSLLGMSRAEIAARFDAIVDFAELHDFIDVPLRAYSSGMAARLGFAVATASDPKILLLDEVLAVGDEAFKAKCLARMREFTERKTTMVLVTHDPDLVLKHCTRTIWLEAGQIRADGEPAAVVEAYHAFLTSRTPGVTTLGQNTGLSASPASVAAGGAAAVSWSGSTEANDWIGLYPAGAPNDKACLLDSMYVNCTQTPTVPVPSGSCEFPIGTWVASGSYEFRLMNQTTILATSNMVTVTRVTLSASPDMVVPGGTARVSWRGSSSPTDWIGLFAAGAPSDDAHLLAWAYVNGGRSPTRQVPSGSRDFAMPTRAGSYEFRLFSSSAYVLLATSNAVTVPAL